MFLGRKIQIYLNHSFFGLRASEPLCIVLKIVLGLLHFIFSRFFTYRSRTTCVAHVPFIRIGHVHTTYLQTLYILFTCVAFLIFYSTLTVLFVLYTHLRIEFKNKMIFKANWKQTILIYKCFSYGCVVFIKNCIFLLSIRRFCCRCRFNHSLSLFLCSFSQRNKELCLKNWFHLV